MCRGSLFHSPTTHLFFTHQKRRLKNKKKTVKKIAKSIRDVFHARVRKTFVLSRFFGDARGRRDVPSLADVGTEPNERRFGASKLQCGRRSRILSAHGERTKLKIFFNGYLLFGCRLSFCLAFFIHTI